MNTADSRGHNTSDIDAHAYMIFVKDHKNTLDHLDWKERMPVLHNAWASLSQEKKDEYRQKSLADIKSLLIKTT